MRVVLVICWCTSICASEYGYIPDSWVDPSDMRHYDRYSKSMKSTHPSPSSSTDNLTGSNVSLVNTEDQVKRFEAFLQRFVNLFLNSASLKDEAIKPRSNESINRKIEISITAEELNRLRMLGKRMTSRELSELDKILSTVLNKERQFSFNSIVPSLDFFERIFCDITLEKFSFVIGTVSFAVCLWMFAMEKSLTRIFALIFLLFFMAGLALTWRRMYQEAVADQFAYLKTMSNIPTVCSPRQVSFWSWSYFFGSVEEECKKYYKQIHIDPFSKVSPSSVISETTSVIFIHPLKALGSGIGDFIKGISGAAPWPLNYLFLPITFLMLLAFLLIFLLIGVCRLRFSFWTWFGGFKIGGRDSEHTDSIHVSNTHHLQNILDGNKSDSFLIKPQVVRQYVEAVSDGRRASFEKGGGDNFATHSLLPSTKHSSTVSPSTPARSVQNRNHNLAPRGETRPQIFHQYVETVVNQRIEPAEQSGGYNFLRHRLCESSEHSVTVRPSTSERFEQNMDHAIVAKEDVRILSQLVRVVPKSKLHFRKKQFGIMKSKYK